MWSWVSVTMRGEPLFWKVKSSSWPDGPLHKMRGRMFPGGITWPTETKSKLTLIFFFENIHEKKANPGRFVKHAIIYQTFPQTNADNTSVRGSELIKAEEGVCGLMKWVTHHRKTQQCAPLPLRLKTAALVWSLKPTYNILENYKSVNSSKALGVFQWL